jgi:hypothetical protein
LDDEILLKKITNAVSEAVRGEMKDFYVDREKHYQHHEFIDSLMEWRKNCKKTAWNTFIGAIATAIFILLLYGFVAWGGKGFK